MSLYLHTALEGRAPFWVKVQIKAYPHVRPRRKPEFGTGGSTIGPLFSRQMVPLEQPGPWSYVGHYNGLSQSQETSSAGAARVLMPRKTGMMPCSCDGMVGGSRLTHRTNDRTLKGWQHRGARQLRQPLLPSECLVNRFRMCEGARLKQQASVLAVLEVALRQCVNLFLTEQER